MKKLLVVLLILGIAAGAFADLTATVTADFNPEIMRITSPMGESAKKEVVGSSGTFDFLSSTANGALGKENEFRLALNYTGDAFAAYARINGDDLIRPYAYSSLYGGTNAAFVNGLGQLESTDVYKYHVYLDEWSIKGTAGAFSAFVGNTGDRGKTSAYRFQNFNDYLKTKIDNFGLMTPSAAYYASPNSGSDADRYSKSTAYYNHNSGGGDWYHLDWQGVVWRRIGTERS